MAKCKYCGFNIVRTGALCSDGKNYHKGCLENYLIKTQNKKEVQ